MNWLKWLVGFSALIIAGCAAYFSVTGLGVLFSGAAISVMVMASSLEFAKLVAATYLKQKWDEITGFNKWYLTISVGVLMLITSAGIFGYLSNAFQAQSLKLQTVDREILVFQTKIDQNTAQITQLSTQLKDLSSTQGTILEKGKVNNTLLRSVAAKDKQITTLNKQITTLQEENNKNTEKINEIKISNLDLEKEVGGFRFIAEAFGMELKNVVKFFIFLIVIVFDPLAVALIIAFNGLIGKKEEKKNNFQKELEDFVEGYDDKTYEVYGDDKNMIFQDRKIYDSGKNSPILGEHEVIVENIINENKENENYKENENSIVRIPIDLDGDGTIDGYDTNNDGMIDEWEDTGDEERQRGTRNSLPYYAIIDFDWNDKSKWINDQNAVNYWLKYKKVQ